MARKNRPTITATNPRPPASDGSDFDEWVHALPPEHLSCRDFGHVWRAMTARWDEEHHSYTRTMKCTRCKTNRTQTVGADGSVDRSSYNYEPGYQAPKGTGFMDRDARATMRLLSTLRLINTTTS